MQAKRLYDDHLILELGQLAGRERHTLVSFLEHLAEFDQRLLHLRLGYPSLFEYLRSHLRFSKAAAYRRMTAARLIARYPEMGPLLREGDLCLVTLCRLKDVLTDDNHQELLQRARGCTEEEVELLVATRRPKAPTRDSIRKVSSIAKLVVTHSPIDTNLGSGVEPKSVVPAVEIENGSGLETSSVRMIIPILRSRQNTVQPLSGELSVLKVTVNREFLQDLERAKEVLSHKVKGGKLDELLRECIRMAIATCEKRQRGKVKRPRASMQKKPTEAKAQAPSRHIPAAVKREVWERDGGTCTYVGNSGMRCNARRRLELHHIQPFALHGPSVASNLTVHCKAHNLLIARDELGGWPAAP